LDVFKIGWGKTDDFWMMENKKNDSGDDSRGGGLDDGGNE